MQKTPGLIEKIYNSPLFGIVCETGCGQPVAQALYSVSGASKTLYFTESPYSKDYQDRKFGPDENRSVSLEKVRHILSHYVTNYKDVCNFFYVASFQVGDETNKLSTHGWIALYSSDTIRYFHVSIYEAMTRQQYFDKISEIGLNLIAGENASHVDCVHITEKRQDVTLTLKHHLFSNNEENIVLIDKNRQILRFESVLRETQNLLLYKGSFNPPHIAHQEIANKCEQKYGHKPIFCISTKTYGKPDIALDDLENRITMLNKLGYSVIISKKPMFKDIVEFINNKYAGKITLLMGSDTFDRYLSTTPEELPVDYVVFQRPGMTLTHSSEKYQHLKDKLSFIDHDIEVSSTLARKILASQDSQKEKEEQLSLFLDPLIVKHLLR